VSRRRTLATVLAVVLLSFGAALVVSPATVFGAVPALEPIVHSTEPSTVLLGLAVALAVLTLVRGMSGRSAAATPPPLDADVPEPSRDRSGFPTVGAALDGAYRQATDYDAADARQREASREDVERELRAVAERAYARQTGMDPDAAAEAVRSGEWTDEPRAAAFLAGEDGPTTPLSLWLVDLVTGRDPFERGAEETLSSIRDLQADERGGGRT